MENLKEIYKVKVIPDLIKVYKNIHKIPKIEKIVINLGIKKLLSEHNNALEIILKDIRNITCQNPCIVKAKKSCDGFSLKKGDVNAIKVTLRNKNMYNFLDKIIFFALPRYKEFEGFNYKSLDKKGNLTFGINDAGIFYEVDRKNAKFIYGMNITVVTNAKDKNSSFEMLKKLYFIFNDKINV